MTRGVFAVAALAAAVVSAPPVVADPMPDLTAPAEAIGAALDSVGARPAPPFLARPDSSAHGLDYLWVVRWSLTDSARIEQAVARAREIGVKGLLAQVVGRGDAYYRSDLLPRAESLAEPDFDPLGLLISRAHAAGLEVHAWVNCMLVWSLPHRPRDPRHVVNAHPEWIARLANGRPMTSLTPRQCRRLGVEGVFLSPAFPGVRAWLGSIVREIVERYAVDGVQLDYIRLPGVQLDGDAGAFAGDAPGAGEHPAGARRGSAAPARVQTPRTDSECAHVAAVVGEVRDSLTRVRPGLPLSAAVLADTAVAERANAQRWTSWLRDGLIDRAFAMCYAPPLRTVVAQLLSFAASPGVQRRVVPGFAIYNTAPATAAAKIRAARALGFAELALYSYDALKPDYWRSLRKDLDAPAPGPRVASPGGTR
ncbi:MAG: hypothetical protein E6K72_08760 [Candidatus Eisenbacteria bacterium]|uniref:Glycosyl hydrolase-like 10 domain-containing protein n=1 Tax=Eiseniibacteriota bacterium TaxID=2212470 RepID=A0A538SNN3_UNCEI|nr:MAG: hypothetical protein E6K72_08760 [Candidatus Eisenbacteria bacterium]